MCPSPSPADHHNHQTTIVGGKHLSTSTWDKVLYQGGPLHVKGIWIGMAQNRIPPFLACLANCCCPASFFLFIFALVCAFQWAGLRPSCQQSDSPLPKRLENGHYYFFIIQLPLTSMMYGFSTWTCKPASNRTQVSRYVCLIFSSEQHWDVSNWGIVPHFTTSYCPINMGVELLKPTRLFSLQGNMQGNISCLFVIQLCACKMQNFFFPCTLLDIFCKVILYDIH